MNKDINIYSLKGNFPQRKKVLDNIKNFFDGYDISIYDESYSYQYVEQQILEPLCFSQNKLIIMNNWPIEKKIKSSPANKFKKLLLKIPKDYVIILNNLSDINKSFFDKIKHNTLTYHFEQKIERKKCGSFISAYFSKREKKINEKEAEMILESFGQVEKIDLDRLYLLLKKIEEYIGNKTKVNKEDVILICSHSNEFIIWNLFKSFDNRDFNDCIRFINILIHDVKDMEHQIIKVLLTILWRYKLLLLVKDSYDKGEKQEEITKKICKLIKLERTGLRYNIKMNATINKDGEKPIYSKGMINSLFSNYYGKSPVFIYDRDELFNIKTAINDSFIKIRGGCSDSEKVIILEIICMVICGKLKDISKLKILKNKRIYNI